MATIVNYQTTDFGDFSIRCEKCGSAKVEIKSEMPDYEDPDDFALDLVCQNCGQRKEILHTA